MKLCNRCNQQEAQKGRKVCRSCRHREYLANRTLAPKKTPQMFNVAESSMRILLLDIETTPDVSYHWGFWKPIIGINQNIRTGNILCFSASWLGEETQFFSSWEDGYDNMVQKAWDLLDEADVVIHYFGSQFDIPWLNRSFLETGRTPPTPFKQVDLKKAMSGTFRFSSNKLQHITQELSLEGKIEHEGFGLWEKCMNGDEDALSRMETYNRRDVELLEDLYLMLLPWLSGHPHRHLYTGSGGCPTCGFETLVEAGFSYTRLSKFQQYTCENCGSFFRSSRRIEGVTIQESVL